MTDPVHVEAARIPDRDRLLATLQEHGLPARPLGEVEIEVPLEDDLRVSEDDGRPQRVVPFTRKELLGPLERWFFGRKT